MAKTMGPFRYSQAPSSLSGHRTDVPADHPLIGPEFKYSDKNSYLN